MPSDLEHAILSVNGIKLHVVFAGPPNGEPVLLLHGFPEFWRGWIKQITPLADAGWRVIVPDQRGYNLSEAPKSMRAYSMGHLVGDVIGLLDHLGIKQSPLVGHDWGAAVAWGTALRRPERVKKLAILNVPHPAVMARFLSRSPRQMLKSWYIAFFQIPGLADWLLARRDFAGALAMLKASGKPTTFSPQDLEEYRRAYQNSGGLTGMINWYRALARYRPSLPTETRLRMPVLILWGEKDIALSKAMAQASLELCDQGKLVCFPEATHWVQHDEAEAVNRHLLEFLSD